MSYAATLTKNFLTGGAVTKRRIVKFSADATVVQAAAATDALIGVSTDVDAASGARCDVHLDGIVEVEAGGTITRGDLLTSDSSGKAVTAAPSTGTNNRIIGIAMVSAVSGDVFPVKLDQGSLQG